MTGILPQSDSVHEALTQSRYFLRGKSRTGPRGRFWAYAFYDTHGCLLLEARFPEIPREVIIFAPGQADAPLVRLKAWRWFWWNGRYDVVAGDTEEVLATLRRTGGIESAERRAIGGVRNSTPPRKHFLAALFVGVLDGVFAQGSSSASLSVGQFRIEAGGREIGTFRRAKLPFLHSEADAGTAQHGLRRWVTRLRSSVARHVGSGWLLDFSADIHPSLDPRVRLAAALLRIQIERRYG